MLDQQELDWKQFSQYFKHLNYNTNIKSRCEIIKLIIRVSITFMLWSQDNKTLWNNLIEWEENPSNK